MKRGGWKGRRVEWWKGREVEKYCIIRQGNDILVFHCCQKITNLACKISELNNQVLAI